MTELRITKCDFEHGCGLHWKTRASELPTSWETVARRVLVDGKVLHVVRHLCSEHRGARVQGQVGGQH